MVTGTLTRPLGELRFESGVPGGSQLKEVEKLPSAKTRSASATRYPTNRHTLPITRLRGYLPNAVLPDSSSIPPLSLRKRSPNFPRSLLYLRLIVTSFACVQPATCCVAIWCSHLVVASLFSLPIEKFAFTLQPWPRMAPKSIE